MPESTTGLWLKRAGYAAAALVVIGGFAYALWPKPVGVDIATIVRQPLKVTIDEEGKTRIRDIYVVSAPANGRLERSPLHIGDTVIAGETEIASVWPSTPPLLDQRTRAELEGRVAAARAAVVLAEAELSQAQSESRLADTDLKRARELARKGFLSEKALDRADTDARVRRDAISRATSALEVRRKELASVEARLMEPNAGPPDAQPRAAAANPVVVRSPASGRVLRVIVESALDVAIGAPLIEIGDPSDLEIVVDLLSQDAVRIRPGAEATIDGWGGPPVGARVRRIDPMGFTKVSALGIEEQRVRTVLDFTGPASNRAALGHDFRVVARIALWQSPSVLAVPLGALFRNGDRWAVFRIASNRAELVHIEIGQRNAELAQVLDGLAEGDRVVLYPSDRVTDQTQVAPR